MLEAYLLAPLIHEAGIAVILAALAAGLVRGFSGFGTALVYMPVAAGAFGPFGALSTIIVMDLVGPLIHIPRALRDGHPGDVVRLTFGAAVGIPIGVALLAVFSKVQFQWAVSLTALTLLVLIWAGVRYRGALKPPLVVGTGGLGGIFSGAVGLPGPPVIMLYMASSLPASAIRANLMLYLIFADVLLLAVLWWNGYLLTTYLAVGAALILPYLLGNVVGAAIFRPEREKSYRVAAYLIILCSAVFGLPIWT